jgi:hypothetical protein
MSPSTPFVRRERLRGVHGEAIEHLVAVCRISTSGLPGAAAGCHQDPETLRHRRTGTRAPPSRTSRPASRACRRPSGYPASRWCRPPGCGLGPAGPARVSPAREKEHEVLALDAHGQEPRPVGCRVVSPLLEAEDVLVEVERPVLVADEDGCVDDSLQHRCSSSVRGDYDSLVRRTVKESSRRLVQAGVGMEWSFNARGYLCFV